MPVRKSTKKSRKRKHEEIQQKQNSDTESTNSPSQNPKRRKMNPKNKKKSPTKNKKKSPTKNKKKSPRSKSSSVKSKSNPKSKNKNQSKKSSRLQKKQSSKKEIDDSSSDSDSSSSSYINTPKRKHKPLQKRRISVSKSSQIQTQSQRRRRQHTQSQSQSQTQSQTEDDQFILVKHNERVMQMYNWLTSSESWTSIKNTLQTWIELESNETETENYSQLMVDIINLILYCGGVRVFKLNDIEDCDIDSLAPNEKKQFVNKLQRALLIDHEDIESLPEDDESSDEETNNNSNNNNVGGGGSDDGHSEDEKAEEADNNNNNNKNKNKKGKKKVSKKKKNKNKKKKETKARTDAEKVLNYDQMLWTNGTVKQQKSFESRYKQLMDKIGNVFELAIFDDDDYIVTKILQWCSFLSRKFKYTQFRKLGTVTGFAICDPFVRCIAKNRKAMEKLCDQLEIELENNKRGSLRKNKKNKNKKKESNKIRNLRSNIEEYKTKIANLSQHTNDVFEQIHAYKASDCNESIRCMVLESIVKWINIDPSIHSFLRERYWQYLLYGLQDKKSDKVRITAVLQLMELFDYQHKFHGKPKRISRNKNNKKSGRVMQSGYNDKLDETRVAVLGPFWDRINSTIHTLLKDKNPLVVKYSIEFINILLRGDMLGAEDGDCILNYIFDESDEIRQMSANFIFHDTFDDQAVLKAYQSTQNNNNKNNNSNNKDEEKNEEETKLKVKDINKMKDDIIEIIQLMKDRVIDLNLRVNNLLQNNNNIKENTLYRNYVQVSDYIVQSMSNKLPVLREWDVLFGVLIDADSNDERQKERNIMQQGDGDGDNDIEDMNIKHYIDDEGQTILCYLILSCIKMVSNRLDIECRNVKLKRGRKTKSRELETREIALTNLSECVLEHLSTLLNIYQADVFKLYPLIKTIELIPINTFNSVESKEELSKILNNLKIIFKRHDTPFIDYNNNDSNNNNNNEEDKLEEVRSDMDDDEREEIEVKIRTKELSILKKCIRASINAELITEIGVAFSYLCNNEYQYKEYSGRFIFDIVSDIIDEFDTIYNKLETILSEGDDMSSMDAVIENDNISILQNLYSNLHKQYALKCGMDVGTISFNENMYKLMCNICDDELIFDGLNNEISGMLECLLLSEIGHNVYKLNFLSPDLDLLNALTHEKQCLVKLLEYYVSIAIHNGYKLCILDRIISMMDCLCFYRRLSNQSDLLNDIFNNASLIEMEPINSRNENNILDLKTGLFTICEYVFKLDIIEDPYDPSCHIQRENIQIRYYITCGRLSILNPTYYKLFGALIISFYNRPLSIANINKNKNKRLNEIMRKILHKLCHNNHETFELMLFEGYKIIMNRDDDNEIDLRKLTIEKIAKSVSMFEGLTKKNRKYWILFGKELLKYIVGNIENIPKYFEFLYSFTIFFKTFTNRDKLEIWTYFVSLSRKLPKENQRNENNKAKWVLYKQFREKLKKEAEKAQRNRSLNLNDNQLENIDLDCENNNNNNNISQSQIQNINMNIQPIIDDDENERISVAKSSRNNNENESENENNNASERISVAKSSGQERISVAKSREDRKEEEENNNNNERHVISHRVSVSKPIVNRDDNDNDNDNDSDVDMKDRNNDSDSDNNNSQKTTESGRRGGLGKTSRKGVSQQTSQRKSRTGKWLGKTSRKGVSQQTSQRKSRTGKWLKRKTNKNK